MNFKPERNTVKKSGEILIGCCRWCCILFLGRNKWDRYASFFVARHMNLLLYLPLSLRFWSWFVCIIFPTRHLKFKNSHFWKLSWPPVRFQCDSQWQCIVVVHSFLWGGIFTARTDTRRSGQLITFDCGGTKGEYRDRCWFGGFESDLEQGDYFLTFLHKTVARWKQNFVKVKR